MKRFFAILLSISLCVGIFSGCGELEDETIRQLADTLKCPAFCGFPYSHTPRNHMLDLFRSVRIERGGRLIFE